jgi:hypothetical protein
MVHMAWHVSHVYAAGSQLSKLALQDRKGAANSQTVKCDSCGLESSTVDFSAEQSKYIVSARPAHMMC